MEIEGLVVDVGSEICFNELIDALKKDCNINIESSPNTEVYFTDMRTNNIFKMLFEQDEGREFEPNQFQLAVAQLAAAYFV